MIQGTIHNTEGILTLIIHYIKDNEMKKYKF